MKNEENLALYNQVRSVPQAAKSRITGGRMNGKTSISPIWRIKTLTEQFGPCGLGWYFVPVRKWVESAGEEKVAFVDIELYVKFNGEWSKPIHGTGGRKLISKENRGPNVSDECYKMATTDALSVACKQLGIGADVYWDEDRDDNYSAVTKDSDNEMSSEAPVLLDDFLIKKLSAEAEKKGVEINSILQQHEKKTLQELNYEEYKETMKMLVSKPDALEERYVNSLWKELKRTGVSVNSLLRNYRKCTIQELSLEEYRDAMNKLTVKPDKPPDANKPLNPALVPPDGWNPEGTPWNSEGEKDKKEGKVAPVQEAGKKKALSPWPLPTALADDGYSYCESFGGN